MRSSVLAKTVGCFIPFLFLGLVPQRGDGASPAPLLTAKKEAETKGYSFFVTHEEIVTMAKKEEKLGVSSNLEPQNFKPLINAFKQGIRSLPMFRSAASSRAAPRIRDLSWR